MHRIAVRFLCAATGLIVAAPVAGQGVALTPLAGAYIPASDFYDLREGAEAARVEKEATFALGAALELGSFRVTLAYATGATVSERGVDEETAELGDGSVLVATAALALRPVPRFVGLQPYLLVGGGLKREDYSFDADGVGGLGDVDGDVTDPTAHIGLGTDLMVGSLGIVVEVNDFISYDDGDFGRHDAFALVGVRLAF